MNESSTGNPLFLAAPSDIEGNGLFTIQNHMKGSLLFTAFIWADQSREPFVFPETRLINHSDQPNTRLRCDGNAWVLQAADQIGQGDELTIDYSGLPSCMIRFLLPPKNEEEQYG